MMQFITTINQVVPRFKETLITGFNKVLGIHLWHIFALLPRMLLQILRGRKQHPWSVPMRRKLLHLFNQTMINETKGSYMRLYNRSESRLKDIRQCVVMDLSLIVTAAVGYTIMMLYVLNVLNASHQPQLTNIILVIFLSYLCILTLSLLIKSFVRLINAHGYSYLTEYNHISAVRINQNDTESALRFILLAYTPQPPKMPPLNIPALRKPYYPNSQYIPVEPTVAAIVRGHPVVYADDHHHALWTERSVLAHGLH